MFHKGQKKVPGSGRKKGSKNKNHLPGVQDYLASRGINPLQKLLEIINDKRTAQEHKLQGWKTILGYCYRKPTENPESEGPKPLHNEPLLDDDTPTDQLLQELEADGTKAN